MPACCAAASASGPRDPTRPVETLSGGNQQKVVIARWLEIAQAAAGPRGADGRRRRRRQGRDLCACSPSALARGLAVLVIATDFEEVANICHRALVFSRGRVVAEIDRDELSVEAILHAASAGGAWPRPQRWRRTR